MRVINLSWVTTCLILVTLACNRHFDGSRTHYEIADFNNFEIAGEVINRGKVLYHLENNIDYTLTINKKKIKLLIKNNSINKVLCFGDNWQEISLDSLHGFISSPDIDLEETMNIILIPPRKEFEYSFKIPDTVMAVSVLNYFLTSITQDIKIDSLVSNNKLYMSIPFNEYPEKGIDYLYIDINLKTLKPEKPLVISSH